MRTLLILVMAASLVAGCGSKPRTDTQKTPTSAQEQQENMKLAGPETVPPPGGGSAGGSSVGGAGGTGLSADPKNPGVRMKEEAPEESDPERRARSLKNWRPRRPKPGEDSRDEFPTQFKGLPGYEQVKDMRNPFEGDPDSVKRGKMLYAVNCAPCHGDSGAGDGPAAVGLLGTMRDLGSPYLYGYGKGDRALYRSIAYGIPGSVMGANAASLKSNEIWDIVNYVKTLQRAEVVEWQDTSLPDEEERQVPDEEPAEETPTPTAD